MAQLGGLVAAIALESLAKIVAFVAVGIFVTYGMFEESRDLAAGERFEVASSRHGRIGVLICEDMWHAAGAWLDTP